MHLIQVRDAAVRNGARSPRLVAEAAVFSWWEDDASSTRILAPLFHALCETIYVLGMKASWKLDAQFVEQLCGSDARASLEAAAHYRPDHRERVIHGLAGCGIDDFLAFRNRFG
jgi:hypothetical protein